MTNPTTTDLQRLAEDAAKRIAFWLEAAYEIKRRILARFGLLPTEHPPSNEELWTGTAQERADKLVRRLVADYEAEVRAESRPPAQPERCLDCGHEKGDGFNERSGRCEKLMGEHIAFQCNCHCRFAQPPEAQSKPRG